MQSTFNKAGEKHQFYTLDGRVGSKEDEDEDMLMGDIVFITQSLNSSQFQQVSPKALKNRDMPL